MSERNRIENAQVAAVDAESVTLRANGSEKAFKFSKYNRGLKQEDLKVGQRIDATILGEGYLADIAPSKETAEAQARPQPVGDGQYDAKVRCSATKIAAMVLQTKGRPVGLAKLFTYAGYVETAIRRGFEEARASLPEREERPAPEEGNSPRPDKAG